jgi:adenine-specific DNA-methyltransferase
MNKLDGKSLDIKEQNIKKLKELFPEVFSEGKIDFEKLENELGVFVEKENERYNFTWNGKQNTKKIAQTPSTGTLRPCKANSKDWDTTQNLYIEGDNLEVLKLLQKSYHKQVKMIYIDPPYNTGKDFVYKDNFKDNIKNYLEVTNQVDKQGNKLSANSETNGRYHSDWLSMMYPRLKLARNLLKDDGVIFISIDDNEVANLRKLCDEIFGEDNFVGEIIRKTKSMTGDDGNGFNLQHENLIIYSKNKKEVFLHGEKKDFKNYKNPDNDPNGDWVSGDPSAKSGSSSTYFEIINPYTKQTDIPPKGRYWAFSKESLIEYIQNGRIKFKKEIKKNERGFIFKRYKNELQSLYNPVNSLFSVENDFMNQNGTKELKEIFNEEYFENPKPIQFIKKLLQYTINKNDLILDFFSGSATTAHAVMQLNAEDGGNRKYILVQLPEPTDEKSEAFKAGYKNICEIGKERIRRAGEKIIDNGKLKIDNKELKIDNLDIGFKVFKLDSSNIKEWDSDYENLEQNLLDSVDNIKEDRSSQDLLYEILLKYGIDLTVPIEELKIDDKIVYNIGYGALIVCLDDEITINIVEKIAQLIKEQVVYDEQKKKRHSRVVFKDGSFKDSVVKTNAIQVLKQADIDEVVSV